MTFNWIHYRMLNHIVGSGDLEKNGIKTIQQCISHYNTFGKKEGRPSNILDVYPDFNWMEYKNNNNLKTKAECEYKYLQHKLDEKNNVKEPCHIRLEPETITFITPTIGRPSLINTIKSVINQTCSNWKYIIVFDGIEISPEFSELIATDSRISSITIHKTGRRNYAGTVRNYGIDKVMTEWIGFVDDDDMLSPYYVERMNNYVKQYPDVKCIIYRFIECSNMNKAPYIIFPPIKDKNFKKGYVGISFCYKKELYNNGIKFNASRIEDFLLLDKIRQNRYRIILANYIGYFVRLNNELSIECIKKITDIEKNITLSIIN
jgi:hypothetical protein